jgi:uncharacterized protein (DUF1800 family)
MTRHIEKLFILLPLLILIPDQGVAMNFEEARHLLSRTGFGASYREIREFEALDHEKGADRILATITGTAVTSPPTWISDPLLGRPKGKGPVSSEARKARQKMLRERSHELKAWWYREMIDSSSQVQERMTLFWHNHFTSSFRKVKSPYLLYRQNKLLRKHATGNFAQLLNEIVKDPAMVFYLDTQTNLSKTPNENFTRELLELFTLGEGNYSESDIKEGARAFTGWSVNRKTGMFRVRQLHHDEGRKKFMDNEGNFGGEDIVKILLKDPRTAEHITKKLWREFISDTPDLVEIKNLARIFRQNGYELKPLLKALWTSSAFRDPGKRGTLIKSPVELTIGTIRTLEIPVTQTLPLVHYGRVLGQDIFDPPNVKGWPGGTSWIDTNTFLLRKTVLLDILHGTVLREEAVSNELLMKKMRRSMMTDPTRTYPGEERKIPAPFGTDADIPTVVRTLLPTAPVEPVHDGADRMRTVRQVLLDPAYNLK